jgi:hypothetical protein
MTDAFGRLRGQLSYIPPEERLGELANALCCPVDHAFVLEFLH